MARQRDRKDKNPATRFGLGLYQIVVNAEPVLIYAARSAQHADRYFVTEGSRLVLKFQGDVLSASDSNVHVAEATPTQVDAWTAAFNAAVDAGEVEIHNPTAFAMAVTPIV